LGQNRTIPVVNTKKAGTVFQKKRKGELKNSLGPRTIPPHPREKRWGFKATNLPATLDERHTGKTAGIDKKRAIACGEKRKISAAENGCGGRTLLGKEQRTF